jgi:hypothetical protein
MVVQAPIKDHTHGIAAAARSTARNTALCLASRLGMRPFFYQMSRSEQERGLAGSRQFYWTKDLDVPPSFEVPQENDIVIMVDTDYYVNMLKFLCDNPYPTLLYTMVPETVSHQGSDGIAHTFNSEDELVVTVAGGATYKHQLWNYGHDHVFVQKKFCGVPYAAVTYLIDRRRVCKDHYLVLLTPTTTFYGLRALLSNWLCGTRLTRLRVVFGKFLRMYVMGSDGLKVSTGIVNGYSSCMVSADVDSSIRSYARTSKQVANAPSIRSMIPAFKGNDNPRHSVYVLVEYHRSVTDAKPDYVFPVEDSVRRYQFGEFEPEALPALHGFMNPVILQCYSPDRTTGNDQRAVFARVTSVRSHAQITPSLLKRMTEFIDLAVPDKWQVHPKDVDDVYDKQNRPSQRRILDDACWSGPYYDAIVRSFVKTEAYGDPKDPRIISTIHCALKLPYSRYMYSLAEHMKKFSWYAFGQTPREIADRIVDLLSDADSALMTDFSRFDGHVSPVLRHFELMLLMALFHPMHHEELTTLHSSQYFCRCVTRFGIKYDSFTSRLSGSPETSLYNTVAVAFVAFNAFRALGYSPFVAFSMLGIYGGDDGMTPDMSATAFENSAKKIGQVTRENDLIHRGELGITFLSRYYGPNVWFGDRNSMCDLARQLAKFHTSKALPSSIKPITKAIEKARSYFLTDHATPVIGALSLMLLSVTDSALFDPNLDPLRLRSWWSLYDAVDQYPNRKASWMLHVLETTLPGFDLQRFTRWVRNSHTVKVALSPPLCLDLAAPNIKPGSPLVVVDYFTYGNPVLPKGWDPNALTQPILPVPSKKRPGKSKSKRTKTKVKK